MLKHTDKIFFLRIVIGVIDLDNFKKSVIGAEDLSWGKEVSMD